MLSLNPSYLTDGMEGGIVTARIMILGAVLALGAGVPIAARAELSCQHFLRAVQLQDADVLSSAKAIAQPLERSLAQLIDILEPGFGPHSFDSDSGYKLLIRLEMKLAEYRIPEGAISLVIGDLTLLAEDCRALPNDTVDAIVATLLKGVDRAIVQAEAKAAAAKAEAEKQAELAKKQAKTRAAEAAKEAEDERQKLAQDKAEEEAGAAKAAKVLAKIKRLDQAAGNPSAIVELYQKAADAMAPMLTYQDYPQDCAPPKTVKLPVRISKSAARQWLVVTMFPRTLHYSESEQTYQVCGVSVKVLIGDEQVFADHNDQDCFLDARPVMLLNKSFQQIEEVSCAGQGTDMTVLAFTDAEPNKLFSIWNIPGVTVKNNGDGTLSVDGGYLPEGASIVETQIAHLIVRFDLGGKRRWILLKGNRKAFKQILG